MFVKASKRITMKNYSNKFKVEALWCNNRRLIIWSLRRSRSRAGVAQTPNINTLLWSVLLRTAIYCSPLKVTDIINGWQRIHTSTNYCSSLNIWKRFILLYDIINISSMSVRPDSENTLYKIFLAFSQTQTFHFFSVMNVCRRLSKNV